MGTRPPHAAPTRPQRSHWGIASAPIAISAFIVVLFLPSSKDLVQGGVLTIKNRVVPGYTHLRPGRIAGWQPRRGHSGKNIARKCLVSVIAERRVGAEAIEAGSGGQARAEWGQGDEVKVGTIMVHRKYGFCRIADIPDDASLILQFADGRLLVNREERRVDPSLVTLYKKIGGNQNIKPDLSTLQNTRKWDRKKAKVENGTLRLAKDLMDLYSQRQQLKRTPCAPDGERMRNFEEGFSYEPTIDQIKCFEDVQYDMTEKIEPMDRLICGDVGFGKTEVGMRAIYRAVCNGRQAALLVPSTILAKQHYDTMRTRMPDVKIDLLTGKTKPATARAVRARVQAGETEVLIGTHSLLSESTVFSNLGLLVVDEEQRFGVSQKERIKSINPNLDVLTLSATPIPRTLQMSFIGLRDISLLRTAPKGRQKVETKVGEISAGIIRNAIKNELRRKGQVLFVVPRKGNIDKVVNSLEKMVRGLRVTTAYGGQLDIDENMKRFAAGEFDVLVATTIIEIGLDLPKANTVIVNHAQLFGISELHQLRGRVGRRDQKGYAFFLTPPKLQASADMKQRLAAIGKATTGKEIAETDMKIRGAGNILGKDQSGSVGDVGYELFMSMVEESLSNLRAVSMKAAPDCDVSGLLVHTMSPALHAIRISDEYMREAGEERRSNELDAVLKAETSRRLQQISSRWMREFGKPPENDQALLRALLLRLVLKRLGVVSAGMGGSGRIQLHCPGLGVDQWGAWAPHVPETAAKFVEYWPKKESIYIDGCETMKPLKAIDFVLKVFIPILKYVEERRAQLQVFNR
ncbi:hypothetical protein AAMO2058_000504500 [Amorphochlora amoebiformis]